MARCIGWAGLFVAVWSAARLLPADDELAPRVLSILREGEGDDSLRIGVWCGKGDGTVLVAHLAEEPLGSASSIKTAILVELFAEFEGKLDDAPLGIGEIVRSPTHPALRHFAKGDREAITQALGAAAVADVGSIMMKSEDRTGRKHSNAVYNAAANVAMALLGGPDKCTERIRARSEEFRGISLQRYMLTTPTATADNTLTPVAMAALYRHLARGTAPGLSAEGHQAVRGAMATIESPGGTRIIHKEGALTQATLIRSDGGWAERNGETVVYVFLLNKPRGEDVEGNLKQMSERIVRARNEVVTPGLASGDQKEPRP